MQCEVAISATATRSQPLLRSKESQTRPTPCERVFAKWDFWGLIDQLTTYEDLALLIRGSRAALVVTDAAPIAHRSRFVFAIRLPSRICFSFTLRQLGFGPKMGPGNQLFGSGFGRDGLMSRRSSWNGFTRALTRFLIRLATSSTSRRFLRTMAASSVASRSPELLSINPDLHTAFASRCRQFSNSVIRAATSGVDISAFT